MKNSIHGRSQVPDVWERIYALEEVDQVAKEVLQWSRGINLWMLEGPMGAGKTTFVRAVCAALDIQDSVNSPTFGIVQEYQTKKGHSVFHIDGYRLENEGQIESLGIDSVMDGHQLCLIEWPRLFIEYVPLNYLRLEWVILEGENRNLKLSYVVNA
ncbi:MAG: tRNA (adenosine(37)-N6)-threonylcarbamoyltransferase complex ATPase subunit type 1 TsaE [Bacteroidota bacterium]